MDTNMQVQKVTVSGVLNKIDTRSSSFRITDSAGNDILLSEVAHPEAFRPLIGRIVTAEGDGELVNDKLTGVVCPSIVPFELPQSWLTPEPQQSVTAGGSFGDGIEGVTEDEIEAFLATL